ELGKPVDLREPAHKPPGDEEAQGYGRVEVAARDVADRRGHHADRETVREGDHDQVVAAGRDDRAGADEDQGEGADELREAPLQLVPAHTGKGSAVTGRGILTEGRFAD